LHRVELPSLSHPDELIDPDKFFLLLKEPCEPRLEIEEGGGRGPEDLKHYGHGLHPDLPYPKLEVLPHPVRSNSRKPAVLPVHVQN